MFGKSWRLVPLHLDHLYDWLDCSLKNHAGCCFVVYQLKKIYMCDSCDMLFLFLCDYSSVYCLVVHISCSCSCFPILFVSIVIVIFYCFLKWFECLHTSHPTWKFTCFLLGTGFIHHIPLLNCCKSFASSFEVQMTEFRLQTFKLSVILS